jgi:DNA-binding LytR/AlgR family response regulator
LRWITASQGQKVRFITVDKVCYFQADNKYTMVMTADSELLIRRPIKELHEALDPQTFWQIHRSTLVNVNEIADVTRDMHGHLKVQLRSRKESLAVSEPYNHLFRQM